MQIGPMNPWLSMWSQPRTTIRFIIQTNPGHGVFWLSAIYLFHLLFVFSNFYSMGLNVSFYLIFVGILALSFPLGIAWLYFMGWILHFTGKWLHGKAPASYLRASLAWSMVPYTICVLMWLILMVGNSDLVFIQSASGTSLVFINLITFILGLWAFILLIQSVREVQSFSPLRALANVLLYAVVSTLFLIVLWLILGFVFLVF